MLTSILKDNNCLLNLYEGDLEYWAGPGLTQTQGQAEEVPYWDLPDAQLEVCPLDGYLTGPSPGLSACPVSSSPISHPTTSLSLFTKSSILFLHNTLPQ